MNVTSVTSDIIKKLKGRSPLPPLCPKQAWNSELSNQIEEISDTELMGRENSSELAAQAVRSGLVLWNDDLYRSHAISQQIPESIGSYWHGIMHRREADFSNAKHWFRMVGSYPLYETLYEQGSKIYPKLKEWGSWDPYKLIDEVEAVVKNGEENSEQGQQLRELQVLEMSLLIEDSLKQ